MPPLRERPEDVEALARHWAARHAAPDGSGPIAVGADALRMLRAQPWRANARELRSVLDRAVCLLTGPVLGEREIVAALSEETLPSACSDAPDTKQARARLALTIAGGQERRAAAMLGVNRATLYRWLGPGGRPPDDRS